MTPNKPLVIKRDGEPPARKKIVRRGRVTKRRRSHTKRNYSARKTTKRKQRITHELRDREPSVSTISTRMSSRSGSGSPSCAYCGHQCCGRRNNRRALVRKIVREMRRNKYVFKKEVVQDIGSKTNATSPIFGNMLAGVSGWYVARVEGVQIGSRSLMLSPLCINTNAQPVEEQPTPDEREYIKISPQMIYATLKKLTLWRESVPKERIINHMKTNYPVNTDLEELTKELLEKLRIASVAGIVKEVLKNDIPHWCLLCDVQRRGLTENHVTLFWKLYGDTLTPVAKKKVLSPSNPIDKSFAGP